MNKYISLDFDGTLLPSNHKLTEQTKNYLIELQEQGHVIILCSGRSAAGMQEVAEQIRIKEFGGYIISYNGGLVKRANNDETLFVVEFTEDYVKQLYDIVGLDLENFVTYGDGLLNCTNVNDRIIQSSQIMQAKITSNVITNTPKVVLQDEPSVIDVKYDVIKKKVANFDENLNLFRSVPQLIEITPSESSKGTGLKKLFEKEGLNQEKLIAFGDGENDISMLEYANIGFAMENAMENVKSVATHHTLSNNQEGVYHGLKKILGE